MLWPCMLFDRDDQLKGFTECFNVYREQNLFLIASDHVHLFWFFISYQRGQQIPKMAGR